MRSFRRTGAPALVATLALAVSALPSAGIATGLFTGAAPQAGVVAATTPPTATVPAGKLVLTTSNATATAPASGQVARLDATGSPVGGPQTLTEAADCLMAGVSGGVLDFTGLLNPLPSGVVAGSNVVGFRSGSIGVRETKSEQYCNQIDTTSPIFTPQIAETLVLALPASLTDGFGPLKADAASLDVELKSKDVRILATASLNGTPVANYELRSGSYQTATAPLVAGALPYVVTKSATASGGNVQWGIGTATDGITFDALAIRAYKGGISLEGGADGGTTTTIDLLGTAEEVLPCGGDVTQGGTGALEDVTVRRLEADAGSAGEGCEPFDVILTVEGNEARFLKPADKSMDAQFVLDFNWTVPVPAGPATVPTTQVDFETGEGPKPIGWCPDPVFDGSGNLIGLANPTPASADMDGTPDDGKGIQFACVGKQSPAIESVVDGTDNLNVSEQIYLLGDVLMRK